MVHKCDPGGPYRIGLVNQAVLQKGAKEKEDPGLKLPLKKDPKPSKSSLDEKKTKKMDVTAFLEERNPRHRVKRILNFFKVNLVVDVRGIANK